MYFNFSFFNLLGLLCSRIIHLPSSFLLALFHLLLSLHPPAFFSFSFNVNSNLALSEDF